MSSNSNYTMSFYEWLHQPEPDWKHNLDRVHPMLFDDLRMSKESVERILEKLDEYEIFKRVARD